MSYKITEEEKNKVKMSSPFALPTSPSERGMKPDAIKKMFWKPFEVLIEIINDCLNKIETTKDALIAEKLEAHNVAELSHADIRELVSLAQQRADSAYSVATGKTTVHVLQSFMQVFSLHVMDPTVFKERDLLLFIDKEVPDAVIVRMGEYPVSSYDKLFTAEELEQGTVSIEPQVGDIYVMSYKVDDTTEYLSVACVESGVDTSAFATKEELDSLEAKHDGQINSAFALIEGNKSKLETVEGIAKGANQAVSFDSYSSMVMALNEAPSDKYQTGQNIMIVTLDVPDLWVSYICDTPCEYIFYDDESFLNTLKQNEDVQVGYYRLSALETQKVDLTEYATREELEAKQDKLSFDTEPMFGSQNPVTSDGVAREFSKFSGAYDQIIDSAKTECNSYTDEKVGDIEATLDSIIEIQNSLIGGENV